MAHIGTNGKKKSDDEKSPSYAAADRTRKNNSGRATVSN
jgi:hypothetical protein